MLGVKKWWHIQINSCYSLKLHEMNPCSGLLLTLLKSNLNLSRPQHYLQEAKLFLKNEIAAKYPESYAPLSSWQTDIFYLNRSIPHTHFITPILYWLMWHGLNGHLRKIKFSTSIQLISSQRCEVSENITLSSKRK
jgi:hypothetical protein